MDSYIVGLDPGSHIGYAILDLDGDLVAARSFKGDLSKVILEISRYGKVLLIGTDVMKVPKFVKKAAVQLGARVIAPEYDLSLQEKRRKTKEYLKDKDIKLKDMHQVDALAAALTAYKRVKSLFNKIDNEVSDEAISKSIKTLVLAENIPIKHAMQRVYPFSATFSNI